MNPGAAHTNAIAVLTLLSLSGCGAAGPSAGPSLVTVGGTVAGLAGTGLTLTDNGIDRLAVPQDGAFAFATRLVTGSSFSVRVVKQPVDPGQICRVAGGDGRVGNLAVSSVSIVCVSSVLSLLAGNLTGPGSVDGAAAVARFWYPRGIAADAGGTIYVADSGNHTIRKISTPGVVTTLAGAAGVAGKSDGVGAAARFDYPAGVAADLAGNVYVADSASNAIRKITPDGLVTTLAGSGSAGSADGAGASAQFDNPQGVAVDATGTVYVADTGIAGHPGTGAAFGIWIPATNGTIRKITPDGIVTTLAGTPGVSGNADGTGAAAQFNEPAGIAADASGTLYVADAGNLAIRKITPAGLVSTLAATAGRLGSPQGVAVGATGTVYVADAGVGAILEITAGGGVTTIAGSPDLSGPTAVTVGPTGDLYVLDASSSAVRRIAASGVVSTFAGSAAVAVVGNADGIGAAAEFRGPSALAADAAGMLFVADSGNHTIRRITPAGLVSTIAGTAGVPGSNDGSGTLAHFRSPSGLAVDALGVLYVADTGNNTIRKIARNGTVTTLAGTPHPSDYGGIQVGAISLSIDGLGPAAQFDGPLGIAVDANGNVYVADTGQRYTIPRPYGYNGYADSNGTIRKITPAGLVSTLAGTPGIIGSADGTGPAAQFSHPTDVATDSAGNVYVADPRNGLVRKIAADGIVTTVASAAGFGTPTSLAIDADGAVYVADSANATISKLTPDGAIATVVGVRGHIGFVPGSLPATIGRPAGLAVREGSLYLTSDNGVAVVRCVP